MGLIYLFYLYLFSTDLVSIMHDCYVQTVNRFFDPSSHLAENSLQCRQSRPQPRIEPRTAEWNSRAVLLEARNSVIPIQIAVKYVASILGISFDMVNFEARVLWSGSGAARLLELWVRIPLGAWMSVSCECCVSSGTGLCDGPVNMQRSTATECGVCLREIVKLR